MPEYLAPGVYVEETSFRSKSIEGVGTSTTAFVASSSVFAAPLKEKQSLATSRSNGAKLPMPFVIERVNQ